MVVKAGLGDATPRAPSVPIPPARREVSLSLVWKGLGGSGAVT